MLNLLMTKTVLNLKLDHAKTLKLQTQILLIVGFIHYMYMLLKQRTTFKIRNSISLRASITVLNLPTFHVIAKQLNLNVPRSIENKRAKTLTVENQTEIPIIHYVSMTCFTEVNHQNRFFNIEFAVANIKYNILGAPFFKKYIQNIDFQQNIMTYKEQHPKLPTKTHFSTFTEKDYPHISYINIINCKEPINFKPRSGKTIHFPITNYLNLHFELEDNTKFYPSIPYTYFLQKFKDIFSFLRHDCKQ